MFLNSFLYFGFSNLKNKPKFIFDYFYEEFRHLSLKESAKDLQKIFPSLTYANLRISNKSGIRPQLVNKSNGDLSNEFRTFKSENTMHILNCISPAFTASFPLGRYIYSQIKN